MSAITLITPTGGRPEAFALCEKFIGRQTYKGDVNWLVVDDCVPETNCTMGQTVIRPKHAWRLGQNTQGRNLQLLLASEHLGDKILFIEDDDYYAPGYLDRMDHWLDEAQLVGEKHTRYYNVQCRSWHISANKCHSSLCQTGFRAGMLPLIRDVCRQGNRFLDMLIWSAAAERGKLYPFHPRFNPGPVSGLCIGIKGLPGRPGIGMGHRPQPPRRQRWNDDADMSTLQGWIGQDAAANYAKYGKT